MTRYPAMVRDFTTMSLRILFRGVSQMDMPVGVGRPVMEGEDRRVRRDSRILP